MIPKIDALEVEVVETAKKFEEREIETNKQLELLDDLNKRKQEIIAELANKDLERFARRDIDPNTNKPLALEDLTIFKQLVEDNKELQELLERERLITIGAGTDGESISSSLFAKLWQSTSQGISVRMILDDLFQKFSLIPSTTVQRKVLN